MKKTKPKVAMLEVNWKRLALGLLSEHLESGSVRSKIHHAFRSQPDDDDEEIILLIASQENEKRSPVDREWDI